MNNTNVGNNATILVVEDEFLLLEDMLENLSELGFAITHSALNYEEAVQSVEVCNPDLILLDIQLGKDNDGLKIAKKARMEWEVPVIFTSSHTETEILDQAKKFTPYGYLVKPIQKETLKATVEMALYKAAFEEESRKTKEKGLQLEIVEALNKNEEWKHKYQSLGKVLNAEIPFDIIGFYSSEMPKNEIRIFQRIGHEEFRSVDDQLITKITGDPNVVLSSMQLNRLDKSALLINQDDFKERIEQNKFDKLMHSCFGMQAVIHYPFTTSKGRMHCITFFSSNDQQYTKKHVKLLDKIEPFLALNLDNQWAYKQIKDLSRSLEQEKSYLEEEIKDHYNFEEIIGSSEPMKLIFEKVKQVAKTSTTVIITGESGTGKELIARALHNLSDRSEKPLVKLNCATLPPQLLESELFGHEKGSFTGATERRIGKFELAHQGTIFLDEIGELQVELQAKLLRVLQEKEIERLGGNKVIGTDARVIVATNRDLEKEIEKHKFREDLFYRLNVFPIHLPPLRERKEDITPLALHFVNKACRRLGKRVKGISSNSLKELIKYDWPGNVRELEHTIERSLIVNEGDTLDITIDRKTLKKNVESILQPFQIKTLQDAERELILATLTFCGGKVRGEGGAAELLDINPATLDSRMKKLGIRKQHIIQIQPTKE